MPKVIAEILSQTHLESSATTLIPDIIILGGWRYVERDQETASLTTEGAKGFSQAERPITDSFQLRLWLLIH